MNKELTPLEALKSFLSTRGWYNDEFQRRYDFVVNALKSLDIIKEKKVNVGLFLTGYKELDYHNYKEHLEFGFQIIQQVSEKPLTEEEYDLLKEELL